MGIKISTSEKCSTFILTTLALVATAAAALIPNRVWRSGLRIDLINLKLSLGSIALISIGILIQMSRTRK